MFAISISSAKVILRTSDIHFFVVVALSVVVQRVMTNLQQLIFTSEKLLQYSPCSPEIV